jgi:hypothetical protein
MWLRTTRLTRLPLLLILAAPVLLSTRTASGGDLQLDGRWRQSALREDFTIQQWLDAGCGPPPQSSTTGGGEIINLRMEGDELAFVGGGRVYRTNQCYDTMPTLSRESHSRASDGKTWRTRCVTPPADPRKTVLNTLVVVTTESHIDLVETGRYEITLENGRCMADVKRTRSFDLVRDDVAPTPSATAPPRPPAKDPDPPRPRSTCTSPGEPTKLEVRPSKKLLRTGETFRFRGMVLDAKGCETRTPTTWKVAPDAAGKGVTIDGAGTVTIGKDAPEGVVEIIATAAGKDARVSVEVTSPAHYDDLLARSGLNAAGENEEAASATIESQAIGAGEGRVEDRARERRVLFLGIVGSVLAVLGLAAVVLWRRSRRARALQEQAEERHEARVQEVLDRRRRREAEHAAQARAHEESVEAARAAAKRAPAPAPVLLVCPTCGRQASAGATFCPQDGARLEKVDRLPFPPPAAMAQRPPHARGKICPTCGDRFDGNADYCGKDGTQLVLLN